MDNIDIAEAVSKIDFSKVKKGDGVKRNDGYKGEVVLCSRTYLQIRWEYPQPVPVWDGKRIIYNEFFMGKHLRDGGRSISDNGFHKFIIEVEHK